MSEHLHVVAFRRPPDEARPVFGDRLREIAEKVAGDPRATTVILHVADGAATDAPDDPTPVHDFDATLTVDGLPAIDLPEGAATYAVGRRVIKRGERGADGARTPGFVMVCPTVRAAALTHEEYDEHWRVNHAPLHVRCSPGTAHYEQLTVREALTPGAPAFDGFGWLGFTSGVEYAERLFGGPEDEQAIFEDIPRFLDYERSQTFVTSEHVYRDGAA
jgi:hypothetical protein